MKYFKSGVYRLQATLAPLLAGCYRLSLAFLFFWAFVFGLATNARGASGKNCQNGLAESAGFQLPFTIADFDGDLHPDTARVEAGTADVSKTDYWIQLQVTTRGQQSFEVTGPSGGLQISARDVNGDHAVDLVLRTAWFHKIVAVLLNDGHGRFARVAARTYRGAPGQCGSTCVVSDGHLRAAVFVARQSRSRILREIEPQPYSFAEAGFPPPSRARLQGSFFLASHPGRAPPFSVHL